MNIDIFMHICDTQMHNSMYICKTSIDYAIEWTSVWIETKDTNPE